MDRSVFYNIYINARLSFDQQKKNVAHEMEHIARGDLFSYGTLDDVGTMLSFVDISILYFAFICDTFR